MRLDQRGGEWEGERIGGGTEGRGREEQRRGDRGSEEWVEGREQGQDERRRFVCRQLTTTFAARA